MSDQWKWSQYRNLNDVGDVWVLRKVDWSYVRASICVPSNLVWCSFHKNEDLALKSFRAVVNNVFKETVFHFGLLKFDKSFQIQYYFDLETCGHHTNVSFVISQGNFTNHALT